MPVSLRTFLGALKPAGAAFSPAFVAARGREASTAGITNPAPDAASAILLDSNENPLGPGPAAMDALTRAFVDAGRYPSNARPNMTDLRAATARRLSVKPENVALGAGSWEILRTAVRLYTSSSRHLVTAAPTFENPEKMAEQLGVGVRRVPVDKDGRLDLDQMAQAARWAGLVFLCNPNNPTGRLLSGDAVDGFIERVFAVAPESVVMVDEAYHDYVTDPSHRTQVPRAIKDPRLIVARTFSKAHGMAGMRIGYAIGHPDTIKRLTWEGPNALNVAGIVAATASIKDLARLDREKARNTEARKFTIDWFAKAGFASTDSQTNFVFVDIKRPTKGFREACKEQGVLVACDFPPFEKSHVRISIGTLAEMKTATEVFGKVLGVRAKAA